MNHIKPGFFVQIPNELLVYTVLGYSKDPDIRVTPTTLGVYLALYQHRHTSGGYMKDKACVSLMRLAIELGASKNTVAKHISILENVGLITVTRLRSGNIYSFNAPLSIEEFIDKYPDEYQIYKEKLDKLYNIKNERDTEEWSIYIKFRDNKTCQVCGETKNLKAHHLDGYNWAIDRQLDPNNGITVCLDCHKAFHSLYGYGDNTAEQFVEWINENGKLEQGKQLAYQLYKKLRSELDEPH